MKLIVAGASHGLPEKHRFCTSLFLQVQGNTYIIDAGAPVSALLDRYDIPHNQVKAVMITHAHTDHLNGLPAFCSELMWWKGYQDCDPQFLYPERKCIRVIEQWCSLLGRTQREGLKSCVYREGVILDDGIIKVTALKNNHCDNAFSFRMEAEGKKLFFTGDLGYGFGEYLTLLGDTCYDLVVCEGAHHDPGSVNEILKQTHTKRMIIHHINLEREPKLAEFCGVAPFPCELAEDGLTVEI